MSSNSEWTQILSDAIEKSVREVAYSTTASTGVAPSITADELIGQMKDAMKKIGPPPVDPARAVLDQIRSRNRETIIKENEARQRAWDKEFNSQVLDIVRKAIHRGLVQVMIYEPLEYVDYENPNKTIANKPVRTVEVRYDKYRKDAYQNVREQAENAVRMNMPPPKLIPIPVYPVSP